MSEYNQIFNFGGVYFELADISPIRRPSTLKTRLGKTFIEKQIPMRDANDIMLEVNGIITGLSRTSAQTQAQAIEVDRAALIALQDGTYHAYDDGRHSGNFAIVPESLTLEDSADNTHGQPKKFSMTLIQWQ